MKKIFLITTLIGLGLIPALAQIGPRTPGPSFGGAMDKLFGANQTFSATLEFQGGGPNGATTMPGKFCFDTGKSRFEINMSEAHGSQMQPGAMAQMKAMGMDQIITISRPDLKLSYLVYPGLNSYVEMPSHDPSANATPDDYKADIEKLGAETVDGHDCVKNKVTVTDKEGNQHVSTVWNATDLKDFPVKIVTTEQGNTATMSYKNVSFDKPAASSFELPSGLTKYDNFQAMIQAEMMKKMGGGMAMPPQGK
jgi:hypothetical protein